MAPAKTYLPPKPGKERLLIKSNVNEALAGMQGGEERTGFLGKGNIIRKPDYEVNEQLSAREKIQKKLYQKLLADVIEPNSLSQKSTPAMDKRALVNKLNKATLDDLMRLIPESLKELTSEDLEKAMDGNEIPEEQKAEIQNLYMDISP